MTPPRTPARRGSTSRPGRRLLRHDRNLGQRMVAGVDEAGRGCLAGPMVVAAVVLDHSRLVGPEAAPLGRLDDSKKLTPAVREQLYDVVMHAATSWAVVLISPSRIDRAGLHRSNLAGMQQALRRLRQPFELALVDGFQLPDMAFDCRRIIKGDGTSASIAAAAIIAKVTRDRLMVRLDERYDGRWAFADHMGYATPLHHERIVEHGLCDLHRRSFDSVSYQFAGTGDHDGLKRISQVVDPLDGAVAAAVDEADIEAIAADAALLGS